MFGKKIYGKNFKNHPYYKKFVSESYKFLNFDFLKIYKNNLSKNFFVNPKSFLIQKKISKIKSLAGFHTRNVPHSAHQWIHRFLVKKFRYLLIQPMKLYYLDLKLLLNI